MPLSIWTQAVTAACLVAATACNGRKGTAGVIDSLRQFGCDSSLIIRKTMPATMDAGTACVLATTARRAVAQGYATVAGVARADTLGINGFYVLEAELLGGGIAPDSRFWSVAFEVPAKRLWASVRIDRESGAMSVGRTEPIPP